MVRQLPIEHAPCLSLDFLKFSSEFHLPSKFAIFDSFVDNGQLRLTIASL
jgi:hypothetical protein